MHILFANDDGIQSDGLKYLAEEALKRGYDVTVCAPNTQRSAASHCITLSSPILVEQLKHTSYPAYAIHGTPVDCVRIGLDQLVNKPVDMVISGINDGYNDGRSILYSGTVAAAKEAALSGLKSVAVSIDEHADENMLKNAASLALDLANKFYNMGNPPKDCILNINIPSIDKDSLKEPVMCYPSNYFRSDGYVEYISPRRGRFFWLDKQYEGAGPDVPFDPNSDSYNLSQGYIAC
ncbi:MAG: 5'/3'-nucleotidase SurE, partial [Christensenellaceae bacterium]|nr:5'/3'-nucleotidase SurE [Christensenellaceae bacterium]